MLDEELLQDSNLQSNDFKDFNDLDSPMMKALKQYKSKSTNLGASELELRHASSVDSDLLGNPIDEEADLKNLRSINDPIAPPSIDILDSEMRDSSQPMIKDLSKLNLKIQTVESDLLDTESPLVGINVKLSAGKLAPLDTLDNELNCLVPKIIESTAQTPVQQPTSPPAKPQWDEYQMVSIIGEGSYGKIYKVKKKNKDLTPD